MNIAWINKFWACGSSMKPNSVLQLLGFKTAIMCRLNLSFAHKRANSICRFWICSKFLTPAATDSEVPSTSKSLQRTHWVVLLNRFLGCFVDLMQVVEPAHGGIKDPKSQICAILNSSAPSFFLSFFHLGYLKTK